MRSLLTTAVLLVCSFLAVAQLQVDIPDSDLEICVNDTLDLQVNISEGPYSKLEWNAGFCSFQSKSSTTTKALDFAASGMNYYDHIYVVVTDTNNQQYKDSVRVQVKMLPRVLLKDLNVCQAEDTIWLDEELVLIPGNPNLGRETWSCNNCSSAYWPRILKDKYEGVNGLDKYYLTVGSRDLDMGMSNSLELDLTLNFTNAFGCTNDDGAKVMIRTTPISMADSAMLSWGNDTINLNKLFKPTPNKGSWSIDGVRSGDALRNAFQDSLLYMSRIPSKYMDSATMKYRLVYSITDTSGCEGRKYVFFRVSNTFNASVDPNALGAIFRNGVYQMCAEDKDIHLRTKGYATLGKWTSDIFKIEGNILKPAESTLKQRGSIVYTTTYNGYNASDSIGLELAAMPKFTWRTPDTSICRDYVEMPLKVKTKDVFLVDWRSLKNATLNTNKGDSVWMAATNPEDTAVRALIYITARGESLLCPFADELFTLTLCKATGSVQPKQVKISRIVAENPTHGSAVRAPGVEGEVAFYSLDGRLTSVMKTNATSIDLSPGIYIAVLGDEHNAVLLTQRVIILSD